MNCYKLTVLSVAAILLFAVTGFAAKAGKTPPVKSGTTAENKEKAPSAPAQPDSGVEINWQVISSGGTAGASVSYEFGGTLGQPAIGYGSSASYGLSQGFWQDFGCCEQRGDVDHSGGVNVADLTYLVEHIFFGGGPPPCPEEGDVDADGGINVADVTYLVEYIFFDGPAPPPCP